MKSILPWSTWVFNYKELKAYFWSVGGVFLLVVCLIWHACSSSASTDGTTFETEFTAAITEYQAETGTKLYPYGIESLRKAAINQNLQTKEQVKQLIKSNEKYFKK